MKISSLLIFIFFTSCFNSSISENSTPEIKEIRTPLYLSTDYGVTWKDASHNLPKEIEGSFLEKYNEEILLATDNLGLFISQKNKTEWKQIGNGLPSKKINSLFVSGNEIYVGVFRKGIFRSKNRGKTWENLNADLPNLRVNSILKIDGNLIVGTDIGIYNQIKNSEKWTRTFNAIQTVSMNYANEKLVAGTNQGTLLSEDQGETWKWIHRNGAAHNTAILEGKIFIMNILNDLLVSEGWGKSWLNADYSPRNASYVYETASLDKFFILSNNYGVHQSNDKGKTWSLVFKIEDFGFFDFLEMDEMVYGTTRTWKEYRGKSK